jgi:hypothetical protein
MLHYGREARSEALNNRPLRRRDELAACAMVYGRYLLRAHTLKGIEVIIAKWHGGELSIGSDWRR